MVSGSPFFYKQHLLSIVLCIYVITLYTNVVLSSVGTQLPLRLVSLIGHVDSVLDQCMVVMMF